MNPTEKKYLRERIDQIKTDKERIINSEYNTDEKEYYLKYLKRIKAADMITLVEEQLERIHITYDGFVSKIEIDGYKLFTNVDRVRTDYKVLREAQNQAASLRRIKLNFHVEKILDEVMLGNSEEALKHLQRFNEMKF